MSESEDVRLQVLDRIYSRSSLTEKEIDEMFGKNGIVAVGRLQEAGYVEKKEDGEHISYEIPERIREDVTEIIMNQHGISVGISPGGYRSGTDHGQLF